MKLFKKQRNKHKTCILLDIDGVLNSYTKLDEPANTIPHTWGRWYVSNANIEFLVQLAYLKNVDVYWISTWGNESNELNDYLDIPKFKVLFKTSKQNAVETALSLQYCRYMLIDDEYADSRIKHIVQPNSDLGLVEAERIRILDIIDTLN